MDFFKKIFSNHFAWLAGCLSLVSITFVGNLLLAVADGVIDPSEFHKLSTHANAIEMFILMAVMSALRQKP